MPLIEISKLNFYGVTRDKLGLVYDMVEIRFEKRKFVVVGLVEDDVIFSKLTTKHCIEFSKVKEVRISHYQGVDSILFTYYDGMANKFRKVHVQGLSEMEFVVTIIRDALEVSAELSKLHGYVTAQPSPVLTL